MYLVVNTQYMDMEGQILAAAEQHVINLFAESNQDKLVYHNLAHTLGVVEVCRKMGEHYRLSADDMLAVQLAAWFHDAGYLIGAPQHHEESGAEYAAAFLEQQHVDPSIIEKVKGCILATRIPQRPTNLLEEITCDSDLFHLGSEQFKTLSKQMRREKTMLCNRNVTGKEWREETIKFLEQHQYFTSYAKALLNKQKEAHLEALRQRQEEVLREQSAPTMQNVSSGNSAGEPVNVKATVEEAKKKKIPERGIETMFRLTSANHIELSGMADSKANILISVNSIIVSVLLSVLLRKLDEFPHLVIPTILFLFTCVVTMIFAILSTRPNIPDGKTKREEIKQKMGNLLFFGNFHKMKLEDYEWGMNEMMKDKDFLYGSLIRDIYFLGVVLGRKYRMLRIAYSVFMFGFVISVMAFLVAIF